MGGAAAARHSRGYQGDWLLAASTTGRRIGEGYEIELVSVCYTRGAPGARCAPARRAGVGRLALGFEVFPRTYSYSLGVSAAVEPSSI